MATSIAGERPAPARAPGRSSRGWRTAGRYLLLVLAALVVLVPIWMALVQSLLPAAEVSSYPPKLFPAPLHLSNYREAFNDGNLGRYMVNSAVVTVIIVVGQVVTSVLAAYAFAFLEFPFKRTLFVVFLTTLMVPYEVTIVANFETMQDLHWLDSYQALTVPFLATAFGTFLLRQAFLTVPRDLRDAAALDGYGHLGFLTRVVVPLARPALAALSVFSFLLAWDQYLWPLLVTNRDDFRTVQIGLKTLAGENAGTFNIVAAGTMIAAVPVFVLLIVFQRQLIRGLTAGAVKG